MPADSTSHGGLRLRRHGISGAVILCLAGGFIAALALEVLLRATAYHRQFAQHDATIGYVLTPHFTRVVPVAEHADGQVVVRTNNLGLRRDEDTSIVRGSGTRRILVLGDSQTEGIVNNWETYSAGLERALTTQRPNANGGVQHRVEVLNAAVSGYSPLLEYLWLRERGRRLQPDLIVLALYAGNDIAELMMHHEDFGGFGPRFKIPFLDRAGSDWRIVPPGSVDGIVGRLGWLLETDSRLYALAHRVVERGATAHESPFAEVVPWCMGCGQSMWQAFTAQRDPSVLPDGLSKLDYLFQQSQIESVAAHAPLLVVIIPTKVEVEGSTVAAEVQHAMATLKLAYDPVAFDGEVRQQMVALSERHGLATVDLLPALRSAFLQGGRPLYWTVDWHLNVDGHQVVAQHLAPIVSGFLPTPRD